MAALSRGRISVRGVCGALGVLLVMGLQPVPAFAASGVPARQVGTSAEQSASARAASLGEPIEVAEQRTEYSQTFAQPDGTYQLLQSSSPRRVRGSDGGWVPVDPELERRPDGSLAPKGAVVDLAFSGGGDGSGLIRMADRQGHGVELGWPTELPAPALDGASATYGNVLPDVDLRLTATAEGFREVLVVKTAEAAANPELAEVTLAATGDGLTLQPGAGGGLRAVDDEGNAVFRGPAGQMWDSAGDAGAETQLRAKGPMGSKDGVGVPRIPRTDPVAATRWPSFPLS